jgi:ribosomal protein S18 acetylase RimI-like enzyme
MRPIEIRDLRPDEIPAAVGVLARGMRDNPLHVVSYGEDPQRRLRCHALIMRGLFTTSPDLRPICAVRGDRLLGVAGVAPSGTCQMTGMRKLRQIPPLLSLGPRTAIRVIKWVSEWAGRDPDQPHVHLGPLAVDAHLQGKGIGSQIMAEYCRRLDEHGQVGYLETDKDINVAFYQKFGFVIVEEAEVLGVPNWFMRRPPV